MDNKVKATRMISPMLVGVFLTLAACGGGDGDSAPASEPESTGPGPLDQGGIVCELFAFLLGGECVGTGNTPTCASDPFNNPLGLPNCGQPAPPDSGGDTWITPRVYGVPDTEPNNSISTPAQASLNSRLPGGRGGFIVDGSFNSSSDPADVFIFTLTASGNIEFTLCFMDSSCSSYAGNRIDVGTAYISVLDQDGAVIWSAINHPDSGNIQAFWLDAGVPYYVMVVAADTMGSDLAYRLHVVEAQSQVKIAPPQQPEDVKPNAPVLSGWESGGTLDTITIELTWTPPTENSDGTPLGDLSGYVIYYGTLSGGLYTDSVRLDDPGLAIYLIDLPRDEWVFVITAVNSDGQESDFSDEVHVYPGSTAGHTLTVYEVAPGVGLGSIVTEVRRQPCITRFDLAVVLNFGIRFQVSRSQVRAARLST